MNKLVLAIVVAAVLVVSLGTVELAYAQAPTPQTPVPGAGNGQGLGRGGARGGMMGGMVVNLDGSQAGLLHDEMMTAFAEKCGLSEDALNTRLANGETMGQIALAQGLTLDEFSTLMTGVRPEAVDQALANGEITQEQADWMNRRGPGGGGRRRGPGDGTGPINPAYPDCPYYTPPAS